MNGQILKVESDVLDAARHARIMTVLCERRPEYFSEEDIRDVAMLAYRLRELNENIAATLFGPDAA